MRKASRAPKPTHPRRFNRPTELLHWILALFTLLCWAAGWHYAQRFEVGDPTASIAFDSHAALGFGLAIALILLIIVRACSSRPAIPHNIGNGLHAIRRITHSLLYISLLLALLTGWLIVALQTPAGLPIMGTIIPATTPAVATLYAHGAQALAALRGVHWVSVWALAALITLHSLAALFHHMVLRDDVLLRMCPRRSHRFLNWLRGSRR